MARIRTMASENQDIQSAAQELKRLGASTAELTERCNVYAAEYAAPGVISLVRSGLSRTVDSLRQRCSSAKTGAGRPSLDADEACKTGADEKREAETERLGPK
jgi:hypothetical protein